MGFKENLRKQYLNKDGSKRGFWSWLWNNPLYFTLILIGALLGFGIGVLPALLVLYLNYRVFKSIAFSKDKKKKN